MARNDKVGKTGGGKWLLFSSFSRPSTFDHLPNLSLYVKLNDVRFFSWLANVSVRTLKAFVPSLARADDSFAREWLSDVEYQLYGSLDVRERDHACRVAKAVLAKTSAPQIIRAALLHDIGKMGKYGALERILVHLYTPSDIPAEPDFTGLRGAWQRNRYHPERGAQLLRSVGGCERVAQLIERHHEPGKDDEARLLKEIETRF